MNAALPTLFTPLRWTPLIPATSGLHVAGARALLRFAAGSVCLWQLGPGTRNRRTSRGEGHPHARYPAFDLAGRLRPRHDLLFRRRLREGQTLCAARSSMSAAPPMPPATPTSIVRAGRLRRPLGKPSPIRRRGSRPCRLLARLPGLPRCPRWLFSSGYVHPESGSPGLGLSFAARFGMSHAYRKGSAHERSTAPRCRVQRARARSGAFTTLST